MSFNIRIAEEKDLAALHGLWMEIMNHHAGQGPMFDYDAKYDDELKQSLADRIKAKEQRCYVAIEGDKVIACIFCRINAIPPFTAIKKTGYIAETVVSVSARSKGIGTQLVKPVQAWFDENNCGATELQVSVKNEDGIRFWERLGFKPSTFHMHRLNEPC
jgi:ribosomal protein S18 acetylase RimI-like enzyme